MGKKLFKIVGELEGVVVFREELAEKIKICGHEFFIFKENDLTTWGTFLSWNVSHVKTGMFTAYGFTKKDAIKEARRRIKESKTPIEKVFEMAEKNLIERGVDLPVNK